MPRPYSNDAEKRAFLESHTDVYERLGYDPGKMIEEMMNKEVVSEKEYQNAMWRKSMFDTSFQSLLDDKYTFYDSTITGNLSRIFRAMYRPETSVENIQYNEMIAAKVLTREGSFEVLQEALARLARLTPELIEEAKENNDVFLENLGAFQVGFVVKDLTTIFSDLKKDPEFADRIPQELINAINGNTVWYQDAVAFKAEADLYANKYHYVMPHPFDKDSKKAEAIINEITKYAAEKTTRDVADKLELTKLIALREGVYNRRGKYTKLDSFADTYFKPIHDRMEKEHENYGATAEYLKNNLNKIDILKSAEGIKKTVEIPRTPRKSDPNRKAILKTIKTMEENNKLVKSRTERVLKQAGEYNTKSFRNAAEDLEMALEEGMFKGEKNQYYLDMLSAIENIKNCFGEKYAESKELPPETRATLEVELNKLDKAANAYLETKYKDEKGFSSEALQQIDVARVASAFVRGRLIEMKMQDIAEQNRELVDKLSAKEEVLAEKEVRVEEAPKNLLKEGFEKAKGDFRKEGGIKNFAKVMAYNELIKDNQTVNEDAINAKVEEKMTLYNKVYDSHVFFKGAIDKGNMKTAVASFTAGVNNLRAGEAENQKNASRNQEIEMVEIKNKPEAPQSNFPSM